MTSPSHPFPADVVARKEATQQARKGPEMPNRVQRRQQGSPIPAIQPMAAPVQEDPALPGGGIAPPTLPTQRYQRATVETAPSATPIAGVAHGMVNVEPLGFDNPVASATHVSLDLPSRFAFYNDFKALYVEPFMGIHLGKLSRAASEGSLLPVVEAVSSVLWAPDYQGEPLGFRLTINDFYFVLYWLRMNSYTKTQFVHTTFCNNPEHRHDVTKGLKTEESLKIQEIVHKSNLTITNLETVPDPEQFRVMYKGHAFQLRPATMHDTIEFLEHPKFADPEFSWLASLACFIGNTDGSRLKLDDRVEICAYSSPDQLSLIKEYENLMKNYGVQERINVRCKGCGASQVSTLTLDAHSFLSLD